jgi:peptidoglycan/LPS O-acetylase OafA/YrhL
MNGSKIAKGNEPTAQRNFYFQWIAFLCGVPCIGIVLYHVRVDLWVGWNTINQSPEIFSMFDRLVAQLSIPIPFLRFFVMLFFLISRFCIHYPFFRLCGSAWAELFGSRPANFLIPILFSGTAVLVAYTAYFLVEKPSHELARKLAISSVTQKT